MNKHEIIKAIKKYAHINYMARGKVDNVWISEELYEKMADEILKLSLNLPVSGQFSLATVKKAFEVFKYKGFPHNEPTWEEWAKENLH